MDDNPVTALLDGLFDFFVPIYNKIVERPLFNTAVLLILFSILSSVTNGWFIFGSLFDGLAFITLVGLLAFMVCQVRGYRVMPIPTEKDIDIKP